MEFVPFPKAPRLSRPCVITEKIDGTNASVQIVDAANPALFGVVQEKIIATTNGLAVLAGSRTRWITPSDDNAGFAQWVWKNADQLAAGLGVGHHFGEWWGHGIQRGYGRMGKHFSLFNTHRWGESRPECCLVVPTLYRGEFDTNQVQIALGVLKATGSRAAPGYPNPEGVMVYHEAGGLMLKKTLFKDDEFKGKAVAA